ncbi:MAG: hypothetical protein U0694_29045 [Anaerolineae bacterium]
MPITIEFIRPNRVVLQTYRDPIDAAQFAELKRRMHTEILPAAAGKVHIIADFRQVKNLPGTMLSRGAQMLETAHPNTGTIVFLTDNMFMSRMAQIFARLAPRFQVAVVSSLDEAQRIIDKALTPHL